MVVAISSGNAIRWIEGVAGSPPPKAFQASSSLPCFSTSPGQKGIFCHIGVITAPGETQLTRIARDLNSSAAVFTNIRTAALLAQYALAPGEALVPEAEPTRT